jgi:phosphoadenosine phosphosulfate reductase
MRFDLRALDRHARIAFSFSGGKDSTAVWHLLEHAGLLGRVTTYHMDTGDLLPEMRAVVAHYEARTPNFVRIQGDVNSWIAEHGLPTDLLPHSAHPVGMQMGEAETPLVSRYDCCYSNLMLPTFQRIKADGNTLLIRGTKAVDMNRLPCGDGEVLEGIEICYPLQHATNDEVFAYLRRVGAKLSPVYEHVTNSPECATCSAWWGEKRASYLKTRHPALFRRYKARLAAVMAELKAPLAALAVEMNEPLDAPPLPLDEMNAASDELTRQGVRVLQANRLADTEVGHVHKLMEHMDLPVGATVLDAGCGVGEVARIMGAKRRDLRFVLLNKSEHQLAAAPAGSRYQRIVADFHALPLPAGSIDVSLFCYALCHADHFVALREAARVTRPGGSLFVYDYERTGGDNALLERTLHARAFPLRDIQAMAGMAGWRLEEASNPVGSDLFRVLFEDQDTHAAIFDDLRPAIWRFARM